MKAISLQQTTAETSRQTSHPTFREAFRFWLKLGFISFGGPAGQIAIMQTELVEKKKWISQSRFLHALNYCMLLPGPEAQQLAIYIGWLLHKTWGGIVAGTLGHVRAVLPLDLRRRSAHRTAARPGAADLSAVGRHRGDRRSGPQSRGLVRFAR